MALVVATRHHRGISTYVLFILFCNYMYTDTVFSCQKANEKNRKKVIERKSAMVKRNLKGKEQRKTKRKVS